MTPTFRRLSIQDRIFIGVGIILLLMAAVFAVETAAARTQSKVATRIVTRLLPARNALRNAGRWMLRASDDGALYILSNGSAPQSAFLRHYRADVDHVRSDSLEANRLSDLAQKQQLFDEFQQAWGEYERNAGDAFALVAQGRAKAARQRYVLVSYQRALTKLSAYEGAIDAEIARSRSDLQRNARTAQTVSTSIGVGAIGLGVVVAVRLGGSVRRRLASVSNALWDVVENDLAHMTASFREIAMGNLTAPRYVCARDTLPEGGEPEIEALLASYNGLVNALCEMSARIDDAANDAQRRKEAEERLVYVRQHDELTGLANRQLLQNHLESAISLHPSRAALAVAYVKVVGFKNIEDNFGHDAGNELIRQAAERLAGALGGAHALARGGVDEFIVLLEDVLDAQDAGDRLTRIIAGVSDAYVVGQRNVFVRLAASVSTYPRDGATAEELLRNAHTALEFAEDRGHADVSVYAPAMRHESVQRLTVATDLEHAFRSGQFELYYQPIVDVRAGRISRFEALLRWRHRELGLLAPKAFIDVAEATGIIDHIGEWVLHDACRQARSWLDRGHDVCVSVNVSARQLYGAGLLNAVDGALAQSGLPADHLEVELTENMILRNRESAVETLSALQKRGVHLAIDDFGTGYSWYGYLRYFAPNTLKLDRMFVANINRNPVDQSIAQAMIVLGHELDLKVIAEGVEERSQMLTLRRLDCDEMQGYLFAPPMTPADCERLLREGVPGIA